MNSGRLGACASSRTWSVVDRDGEVEHLVDDRRERGAHQRALHLVGGRVEAVADDLGGDRVGVGDAGSRRPRRRGGRRSRSRSCLCLSASSGRCDAGFVRRGREAAVDVGGRGLLEEDRRARRSLAPTARRVALDDRERQSSRRRANEYAATVRRGAAAWPAPLVDAPVASARRGSGVRIVARSDTISTASSIRCPKVRSYSARKRSRDLVGRRGDRPVLVAGEHGQRVLLADVAHVERGLARRAGEPACAARRSTSAKSSSSSALASASPSSSSGVMRVRATVCVRSAPSRPQAEKLPAYGGRRIVADLELVGEQRDEQRAGAAERHQHRAARVDALLDRDLADRVRPCWRWRSSGCRARPPRSVKPSASASGAIALPRRRRGRARRRRPARRRRACRAGTRRR